MSRVARSRAASTLAIPAIVTGAAMLIGWGVDDLKGFFASPARTVVIAVIIFDFAAGTAWGIELNPFRKGTRENRGWPIITGIFAVPLIWVAVSYCDRRGMFVFPESPSMRWIGVAAFAAGGAIRLLALHELGRQYSVFLTIQKEHLLIQSGIYRRIRHPFYLGGLLNLPGVLLAFRSPLSVIVFLISVAFVVSRIEREERLLTEEFPRAYDEYRRVSWRLMPYVY